VSSDPSKVVLTALFTHDMQLIDEISRSLTENHFVDPILRSLFRGVLTYRSVANGLLTASAVEDLVSGVDAGTAAVVRETYAALVAESASTSDARWAARQLRANREQWLTTTLLRDATEILNGSVTEEDGGRVWSGAADAREWASYRIAEVTAEIAVDDSPAGDIRKEAKDVMVVYRSAKSEDRSRRPLVGVDKLDAITGGFGPGEMIVVAAPSGVGKSHTCVHMAYHAAAAQGLHVYFATSETVRNTVRWRLVAHHSRATKFKELREHLSIPNGLDSNLLKRGELPAEHVEFMALVVQDLARLDGSLWLAQMPHGHTVAALDAQLRQRSRARKIDVLYIDYVALMSGDSRRVNSTREELVGLIKGCKHLAIDYDKGNGLPLVTPWQINRAAQEEMDRTGEVILRGLADTSEIVNTPDMVLALSPDGTRDGRYANLRLGVLKNRDGNVLLGGDAIPVRMDYATSYLSSRVSSDGGGSEDIWGGSSFDDAGAAALLLGGV
jgi:replicative DNA helicase